MSETQPQPQPQPPASSTLKERETIAEHVGTYDLIDSTGGILLGKNAREYNTAINKLIDVLTRRKATGRLLADPTGEATDRDRLRIALTEGELYYRRRATADARNIADTLRQTTHVIDRLLDAAIEADENNNLLGREGLYRDEIEAEADIMNLERDILESRFNYIIGPMRPGETLDQAREETHRIHEKGRRYYEF